MTEQNHKLFGDLFGGPYKPEQEIDTHVGMTYTIGALDDPDRVACIVESITPSGIGVPRVIGLREMHNCGRPFFKTDSELRDLESKQLMRPLSSDPGTVPGRGVHSGRTTDTAALGLAEKLAHYARYVFYHPRFSRSQPRVAELMEESRGGKADPDAQCAMTVLRAINRNVENGWFDPVATALPRSVVIKQPSTFGDIIEKEIQLCLFRILRLSKGTCVHARGLLARRLWNKHGIPPEDLPSLRTIERRKGAIPDYVQDFIRYGADIATERHGHVVRRLLPECPLHTVETDDLLLDCEVVDDATLAPLGRPWLTMIRDRRTGIILGFSVVIGPPSFAGFIAALKHAWFPKDMSAYPGLSYRFHGACKFIVVDAARQNNGDDMHSAGNQLGFEVVELAPASPQLKGGLEATNKYINEQTAHLLPGSVMSNVVERKQFEDTRVRGLLKVSELRFLIMHFICTQANEMPKSGLGPLRTMKGVPGAIWDREIGKTPRRPLMNVDIFARLVGNTRKATIQDQGIQFDYILYYSVALLKVRQHKKHYPGAKYTCIRDPNELGWITVIVDFLNDPIRVPVADSMASYANGLSLDLHKAMLARNTKEVNEAEFETLLPRSRHAAVEVALAIRGERELRDVDGIMARLMHGQEAKRISSRLTPGTRSPAASASTMDLMNPPHVPETEARSSMAAPASGMSSNPEAVRQFVFGEQGIQEVDRGSASIEAEAVEVAATDEQIEAELARIDTLKIARGMI